MENKRIIFTREENEILLSLIEKYKSIIELKELNKVSVQKKAKAYDEIAREFNSYIGVTNRTAKQLRQRYLNMKKEMTRLASAKRIMQSTADSDTSHLDSVVIQGI